LIIRYYNHPFERFYPHISLSLHIMLNPYSFTLSHTHTPYLLLFTHYLTIASSLSLSLCFSHFLSLSPYHLIETRGIRITIIWIQGTTKQVTRGRLVAWILLLITMRYWYKCIYLHDIEIYIRNISYIAIIITIIFLSIQSLLIKKYRLSL